MRSNIDKKIRIFIDFTASIGYVHSSLTTENLKDDYIIYVYGFVRCQQGIEKARHDTGYGNSLRDFMNSTFQGVPGPGYPGSKSGCDDTTGFKA
jgi:hypothetical protein